MGGACERDNDWREREKKFTVYQFVVYTVPTAGAKQIHTAEVENAAVPTIVLCQVTNLSCISI